MSRFRPILCRFAIIITHVADVAEVFLHTFSNKKFQIFPYWFENDPSGLGKSLMVPGFTVLPFMKSHIQLALCVPVPYAVHYTAV